MNAETAAGTLGSGTLTAFLWNGFLVPKGAPEMDAVVAPAAGAFIWGAFQPVWLWLRTKLTVGDQR